VPIILNEQPLPPDDPLFTGGIRIGFVNDPASEEEDVEFVQPKRPPRHRDKAED
jgi:hypothetical protein